MSEENKIVVALKTLDPRKNEHWTSEGLPSLTALGLPGIKRADVTAVAPHFTRDNMTIDTPAVVEQKTREEEIAKEQEDVKQALGSIAEQKAALELELVKKAKAIEEARASYLETQAKLDVILREEHQAGVARKPIHDIMEFIAKQGEQRVAAAAALKPKG